MSKTMLF